MIKEVLTLHSVGIVTSTVGLLLSFYFGRLDKRVLKKGILDLREKRQIDNLDSPVKSVLKVKLNGKRKQKVRFALHRIKKFETSYGQRQRITSISEDMKGNSKREFDLESDSSYSFIVQPDPFIPLIVEFSVIECRSRSDRLFQFGLALFTSGLVIYFAK